jgi:hypothetical protein
MVCGSPSTTDPTRSTDQSLSQALQSQLRDSQRLVELLAFDPMQEQEPSQFMPPHRSHPDALTHRHSLIASILEEAARIGDEMEEYFIHQEASSARSQPQAAPQANPSPQSPREGNGADSKDAPLAQ